MCAITVLLLHSWAELVTIITMLFNVAGCCKYFSVEYFSDTLFQDALHWYLWWFLREAGSAAVKKLECSPRWEKRDRIHMVGKISKYWTSLLDLSTQIKLILIIIHWTITPTHSLFLQWRARFLKTFKYFSQIWQFEQLWCETLMLWLNECILDLIISNISSSYFREHYPRCSWRWLSHLLCCSSHLLFLLRSGVRLLRWSGLLVTIITLITRSHDHLLTRKQIVRPTTCVDLITEILNPCPLSSVLMELCTINNILCVTGGSMWTVQW